LAEEGSFLRIALYASVAYALAESDDLVSPEIMATEPSGNKRRAVTMMVDLAAVKS
jgi:hypothetical protein